MNFVSKVLDAGGILSPLLIYDLTYNGTSIFNPSIYLDGSKLLVNIRHCQYTLYHSEKNKFEHQFGPLLYLNPEDDISLTTKNYLCELDDNLRISKAQPIDTSQFDVKPLWEFVGLEDIRLVRWDNKLYGIGVRRDTTPNGVGRMEMSEIIDGKEVSRARIPAPPPDNTYCEKNWMPIVDMPFHFVKWCNPTEVVKVDPIKRKCETVFLGNYTQQSYDFRGGSQVIPIGDYRVCCVHLVDLFKSDAGKKNGIYKHCFVVWDKNWNVVRYTEPFSFMGAQIEFCAGMTQDLNGDFLISFGFQDNAAYILKVPKDIMERICLK